MPKATSKIVPTVLVDNMANYEAAIKSISTFTDHIQVDLSDGQFATSRTIKLDQVAWPKDWIVDIHMMVAQPSFYMNTLVRMKPSMVIFHVEVDEDLQPILEQLKMAGIKAGIALMRSTVPDNVAELIKQADHVMIFAGELGKMGGEASMMQTEKVRLIKKINPDVEIGWDGGANVDNAFSISRAGVDIINVGSALAYANDPRAVYHELMNQVTKTSVI